MSAPVLDLTTVYTTPPTPVNVPFVDLAAAPNSTVINLDTTAVTDGTNVAYLSSVFKINDDSKLMLDSDVLVTDGTNEASFDFEYDTEGEQFGAGTAFLQD